MSPLRQIARQLARRTVPGLARRVARALGLSLLVALGCGTNAALAAKAAPKAPPQIAGTVVRIVDGDTLWVEREGASEPLIVRLEGIDAPERCQPWGPEATQALSELALKKTVTLRASAIDDWGRTVAKVFDGTRDIGDRMVRDGHAWSIRYRYDRGPYVAEERMAIALKRGLHAAGGAIEPRAFRKRHGPCPSDGEAPTGANAAAMSGAAAAPSPAVPANAAPRPAAGPAPAAVAAVAYNCDGRTSCSQMRSCEEATWFLQHCPGVKMDGNHDGVPCERQWCGPKR